MANIEIITGRTGEQHVLSIDDAELHRTLLGNGDFILSTGERFQARMNGANRVDVYQGTAIMQGRQVKIRAGSQRIETDAGVIGMKRQDAIVIEYERVGDIETVELKVIKGPNNANVYVAPTIPYINGIIDLGEKHQMPLWYVRYNGLNFDSLIDARVVLDTTPIQTALDTATAAKAQIEAEMNSYKAIVESQLEQLRNVVKIAPLTVITDHVIKAVRASGVSMKAKKHIYPAYYFGATDGREVITLDIGEIKANGTITAVINKYSQVYTETYTQGTAGEQTCTKYDGNKTITIKTDVQPSGTGEIYKDSYVEYDVVPACIKLNAVGYTYTSTDRFVLYLNGLKVANDDFTVDGNGANITIFSPLFYKIDSTMRLLDMNRSKYYDVELEVWRPE